MNSVCGTSASGSNVKLKVILDVTISGTFEHNKKKCSHHWNYFIPKEIINLLHKFSELYILLLCLHVSIFFITASCAGCHLCFVFVCLLLAG